MISKLIPFALLLLQGAISCSAETTAQLDNIVIQLRSQSDSNNSDVLGEVRRRTNRFLNDYFGAYYANAGPIGFFDEARVTGNSFGIQGGAGSFINTIEFDGVLAFHSEPVPTPEFIENLLANAFKGLNLDLYIENLLSSDDPFLSQLTHVFIEMGNGEPVTQKSLGVSDQDDFKTYQVVEQSSLEKWAEIAIYATAGVVGAIVVLTLFCLCRCWCGKAQVQDEADVINVSKIEFPTLVPEPPKPQSQRLKSTNYSYGGRRVRSGANSGKRDRSTSPSRSIVSQDSSLFTYNPAGMSRDEGTLSLGSVSNINIETPNFDLKAWQKQNVISSVTPAPFGHDISAIEEKDHLSVMEEGDEGALRTRGSQRLQNKARSSSRRYSRNRYAPSTIPETRGRDSSSEGSNSSSSDVINDLKNLSLQIEEHRRSRTTPNYHL
jgi:hypothetical protein